MMDDKIETAAKAVVFLKDDGSIHTVPLDF